jgi:hypothetical protein
LAVVAFFINNSRPIDYRRRVDWFVFVASFSRGIWLHGLRRALAGLCRPLRRRGTTGRTGGGLVFQNELEYGFVGHRRTS